ncbi:MAG: GNAT family N-acetyltransferase [Calditrichia bacterium]
MSGRTRQKQPGIIRNSVAPPQQIITDNRYTVRFAQDESDIDAALKLRFDVFNLELGEGLDSSFDTMRDRDKYDEQCHHLIVVENATSQVIGTYRMQSNDMAAAGIGFYSADEFCMDAMPEKILRQSVEVGRACISSNHRNGRVLFLLWRGLAVYMIHMKKRYLFGCCSLTSQDPLDGQSALRYLNENGYLHQEFRLHGQPDYICPEINDSLLIPTDEIRLPRLFRTYLNYGAKACSAPVIDRHFKTVDFLVLLDINELGTRNFNLFFS